MHDANNPTSLSNDDVRALLVDKEGTLWVGTAGGLNRFDAAKGHFIRYKHDADDPSSLNGNDVRALLEDQEGTLWVGTFDGGLNRFDRSTGSFAHYLHDPADPSSMSSDKVLSLYQDQWGVLWVGTDLGGVNRVDLSSNPFEYYQQLPGDPDALRGEIVQAIFEDRQGILWIGTDAGLRRLDPATGRITHFVHDPDNPASLSADDVRALLEDEDGTLHFRHPERNQYQYLLENYDAAWREVATLREATYTGLPPGDYVFRVKASNSDGIWNEEGASINIQILPPWWRTWWAYIVYGLLFVAGIITADRLQRRRLIARERLRAEREKAKAIESTNNELQRALKHLTETQDQLVHTEKMASLGQLTAGIAHEIKNPLNFVNNFSTLSVGMLEELKDWVEEQGGMEKPEVRELVETLTLNAAKINEHGQRADGIIRSMLEHSRTGRGERRVVDINKLVDEYVNLAYHGFRARGEGIEVEVSREYGQAIGEVEIYPQEIGRVLINLLDNAFYSVEEKARSGVEGYAPRVVIKTVGMSAWYVFPGEPLKRV